MRSCHHLKQNALALAAAAALGPMAVLPASAATCTWSTTGGNWATLANWLACVTGGGSPAGTPGAADTANIGSTGVVTINTGQSIGTLNNAGQINIDAFGLNLAGGGSTVNSGTINVGGASTANLGISAGHNLNNTGGVINVAAGSVVNQFGSSITGGTINTTGTGALVAFSSSANVLSGVTLNGTLDMSSIGSSRQRIANGLTLNGVVDVANGGILSFDSSLTPGGSQTIGGAGTINLNDAGARITLEGGGVTTIASGMTIRGQGAINSAILVGGAHSLVNNGLISADVAGGTLNIQPPGSTITNNATLEAKSGGTLVLSSDVIGNPGSQIVAGAGSTVRQNGVRISGVINTSGAGTFAAVSSGSNILDGVTLNGTLDLTTISSSRERIANGLTLMSGSAINVGNGGILSFDSSLTTGSNQTIGGAGIINLNDPGARITLEGGGVTTIASGVTIRGQGAINDAITVGGAHSLVNNGLISADVAGGTLNIQPPGGTITNNATLEAKSGGTLVLSSNVIGNLGSQIVAGAGSTVRQNGVRISGVINTSGAGTFAAVSSSANVLDGVTLNGTLDLTTISSSRERIANGLTLMSGSAINVGNGGILSFDSSLTTGANQTIGGAGIINLNDPGARITLEGGGVTTIASGVTIRGQGAINSAIIVGGVHSLVNNGLISADVLGGTLNLQPPGGTITNNATLEAKNGGTLLLSSEVINSASGQIVAGLDSRVVQNGVRVSGTINTAGSGSFAAVSSSSNILDGVALNGMLDLSSISSSRERIANGLTLTAGSAINVANGGILSFDSSLTPGGSQTIGGAGTINLNDAGARITLEGAGVTTIASGMTIRGQGAINSAILVGGAHSLVNNGLISADVAGGTLNIQPPGGTITNNATLEAKSGGTLVLSSDVIGNLGSQIVAGAGSTVRQNGVRISGVINTSGAGTFAAVSSGSNILDGVTLNGTLDLTTISSSRERIANGLTLMSGSAINVGNGGILSFDSSLTPGGNQTIGGVGTINLNDAGARITLEGAGVTTIASGATIRGQGAINNAIIVGGTNNLVNSGTIVADVAGGTLAIAPSGSFTNQGLVHAQNGVINLSAQQVHGTGTLQVAATGVMNLAAGGNTQGSLVMGAAGAALNLNTGNLTISSDYTNAGAGSGNGFNRRAGVTGSGQIVAAADAAQRITGAAVTNGATTNATLTIGSVRVGANTFNYEIGNSGTTGPTLRGAVQTSVNGGNITDARLTGSGVAAGLYNAGAPGGSSGPQNVVFTVSSAGALAPMTGQVLNLRSNFENIADQKLNIVLASGAAAYNAAVGNAAPSPVMVANQRVGGSGSAALTVSNTAAAGAFSEDLRASFGANSGAASNNGGVINALVAGSSDGSAMRVAVDTSTAGAKTGSVTLNYQTTGTVAGVSNGLGIAGANPPQVVTVNGNVYQAASGALQTAPMNFGTIQVGQVRTQDLVVRNTATGAAGFVEDLHAAFGASGNSQITGSGALNGILAGTDSTGANGLMRVTVTAATVGALNSSIAVNYTSAGAVAGVSNGLGTLAVGSQDYGVSGVIEAVGTVISQANPLVNTPTINLGAVRVGAAAPTGTVSVTNVASGGLQAALNASIAPTSGPVTAAGSFNLLNPGATNASSLVVGLNTGTAGNFTGASAGKATISFVSDASNVGGCAPSCTLDLASQMVNVEGKVYTQAVGSLVTGAVNFGVVRVGDTVAARDITINNAAAATALNDTLRGDLGGVSGPFGHAGSVAGIAAGASGSLSVGLDTSTAGIFTQTGSMGFTSQNADMADVSAGADASVSVFAQVNNLANGDFDLLSGIGTLTQSGTEYVLDLGTLVLGSTVSSVLQMDNEVSGPADELSGLFDLSSADDFGYGGWNPLSLLAAGDAGGAMSLNWLAGALGSYADTIVFNGRGTNASDSTGLAQTRRLTIRATVIDGGGGTVPVPGTLSLLLAAAAAAGLSRCAMRKVAP